MTRIWAPPAALHTIEDWGFGCATREASSSSQSSHTNGENESGGRGAREQAQQRERRRGRARDTQAAAASEQQQGGGAPPQQQRRTRSLEHRSPPLSLLLPAPNRASPEAPLIPLAPSCHSGPRRRRYPSVPPRDPPRSFLWPLASRHHRSRLPPRQQQKSKSLEKLRPNRADMDPKVPPERTIALRVLALFSPSIARDSLDLSISRIYRYCGAHDSIDISQYLVSIDTVKHSILSYLPHDSLDISHIYLSILWSTRFYRYLSH